jgi:hypothetical protein
MTAKFPAARKLAVLFAAAAVVATGCLADDANAAPKRYVNQRDQAAYGARGPNSSYMAGPRTRVYVTKRSWLDAGVEVLPGERHFSDYAFPPGYSFARENYNRPLDRQPLNPPSDFGFGDNYQTRIPLPPY